MGWVSYLEDITERLSQDLEQFEQRSRHHESARPALRTEIRSLLAACHRALSDIDDHLELATDPTFDMAYEISELDREKRELEGDVERLSLRRTELRSQIERLQKDGKKLKLEVGRLKRKLVASESELNQILSANPDLAYELYTPPERDWSAG